MMVMWGAHPPPHVRLDCPPRHCSGVCSLGRIAYPSVLEHRAVAGTSTVSWAFLLEKMITTELDTLWGYLGPVVWPFLSSFRWSL